MVLLFHEQEPRDLPNIKIFYTYFTLTSKNICLFVETNITFSEPFWKYPWFLFVTHYCRKPFYKQLAS